APLYETVLEIDERISANGAVVRALDSRAARAGLLRLREAGITSLAIVLLHSWIDPAHELELAELAREVGFEHVTTSGACGALIKLVPRGRTAVLDAYLSPVLQAYIDRVASALAGVGELLFMQSSGGLADRAHFAGRNAVLSGPAGGVVGAIETARQAGFDKIIGFDMGGTSTDVCHYGGRYERAEEAELAGVTVRVPMLDIHTVAAGGGSVLSYDGARFQVGPESAGASPGPACYGRGGPLAVTDIHAVLGRLQAEHFPRIFGPDQNAPLDIEAARDKFSRLAERAGLSVEATAEGFLKIAITHMAGAIKEITTGRGIDLEGYTLVSFGGAGGQHACLVAEALGLERIFIHPLAGVLSALGIGLSGLSATRQKTVGLPLEQMETARAEAALLLEDVKAELRAQGVNEQEVEGQIWAGLRYDNADTVLELDFGEDLHAAFERAHKRRFGFIDERAKILIESLRVEGRSLGSALPEIPPKSGNRDVPAPVRLYAKGAWHTAPVLWRDQLEVGKEIVGPAVILDQGGTNIIESGWVAVLNDTGGLVAERRSRTAKKQTKQDTASDPVRLELFNQMFMAVARRMGAVLGQTARSVNIKERLDYSCAVFDAQGGLVANAPHMPVHIGSMDLSVKAVIRSGLPIRPGVSFVHNNPYAGGTHLPDINVITPVFDPHGEEVLFYVCARGHHADIGGLAPGSMSPLATTIEEEGVVIDVMPLVEDGRFLEAEMM
ncbi:MAG TPA: 5-oxoprolinase, partial [Hellea balneolensis]|nr:5-oxoprolinase [Hellea balneolensis]